MAVMFERNVPCTLRDGVVLKANIFRPADGGPYPVLLVRLPYGKNTPFQYSLDPLGLAESGYIVAIQDVRGRFTSGGTFELFTQEFNDGYDSVDWASKLPGSTGHVGMYGASYFGYTQLAAAASGHPALKAIAPAFPIANPMEGMMMRGGALEWGLHAGWSMMLAPTELARVASNDPAFPLRFYQLVKGLDHLAQNAYWDLPLTDFTPLKQSGIFPEFFTTVSHPQDMADAVSMAPRYPDMSVGGLFVGGWFDICTRSTINGYQEIRKTGHPARLVMGPWTHGNFNGSAGDLNFGLGASGMLLDLKEDVTTLHRRWFDAELKGADEEFTDELPIKIFVMGENRWKLAAEWPLPETVYTPWYLHSQGRAETASGDGTLTPVQPGAEQPDRYTYDPAHPVITLGGSVLLPADYRPGPVDQAVVESRPDVLVYTSKPLTEPLEVTGPLTANLWVASSALDTDFVVRVTDVHPNGRSLNVVDGILRMRYRHGLDQEELMEPGTVYPIAVDLWDTSMVFLPGHRIRVQITSSSFPRWNRNLNTGRSNEETAEMTPAQQQIYHDADHPSHIILPVIPR